MLKHFARVSLDPGHTTTISFTVSRKDMQVMTIQRLTAAAVLACSCIPGLSRVAATVVAYSRSP